MRILALEPYNGGSHLAFLEGWSQNSRHKWTILGLPPYKWKWRMRHTSITLADEVDSLTQAGDRWDLIFCSDMLNLAEFRGLVNSEIAQIPTLVYFHENQLTYPVRDEQERDIHFAITNLSSALAADRVWFNSSFHRESFLNAMSALLKRMPDYQMPEKIELIKGKSAVQPQGINPIGFPSKRKKGPPRILWVARWEHDKNPELFFKALQKLLQQNIDFRVSIIGEQFQNVPEVFEKIRYQLKEIIDNWGYITSRDDYTRVLQESDIVVSTANHEFFGVAIVEAISASAFPLLPQRLSYPEILKVEQAKDCQDFFYDGTEDELTARLTELITRLSTGDLWCSDNKRAEKRIIRFYWSNLAPCLDDALEGLWQIGRGW